MSLSVRPHEETASGYRSPAYAHALAEFGEPVALPRSGSFLLKRPVKSEGPALFDAMGPYPLLCCADWSGLADDLAALTPELVSLVAVVDPFAQAKPEVLSRCFPQRLVPYKEHLVVDLSRPLESFVKSHHRRNANKALRNITVERCSAPAQWLSEWCALYQNLVERHGIRGIAAFSKESFQRQLQVPGIEMFRAVFQEETVGMLLWYRQGEVAYYHLGAYSDEGYERGASFALFWRALETLADAGVLVANLGAGAALSGQGTAGLVRFKSGWATGTRPTFLGGRIFQPDAYAELVRERRLASDIPYFPAYRYGEFT
jgi:hypothetical protein